LNSLDIRYNNTFTFGNKGVLLTNVQLLPIPPSLVTSSQANTQPMSQYVVTVKDLPTRYIFDIVTVTICGIIHRRGK